MQLVQCLGVNLERRVVANVALDDSENLRCHVLGDVPVLLVPFLQHTDRAAGNLDIQFNVLGQSWVGEIRGADERE
jgi:hypothetical protein